MVKVILLARMGTFIKNGNVCLKNGSANDRTLYLYYEISDIVSFYRLFGMV